MVLIKNKGETIVRKLISNLIKKKSLFASASALILMIITGAVFADTSMTIGDVASQVTGSFAQLGRLITAGSYLAGLGFSIGAIMKFKQHKDNPTQITIGTPIALVFIAAALLFLPTILSVSGATMFSGEAKTAGPTGTNFTNDSL